MASSASAATPPIRKIVTPADLKGIIETCSTNREKPLNKSPLVTEKLVSALQGKGYELVSMLGSGTHATVFKVKNLAGEFFAAKIHHSSSSNYFAEFGAMKEATELTPAYVPKVISSINFKNDRGDDVWGTIMSYHQTSLQDLLDALVTKKLFLSIDTIHQLVFDLLTCIQAFETKYQHLDIKPDNILVDFDPASSALKLTLADFGSSFLKDVTLVSPIVQTLWYRSPLTLHMKATKLDVFSIACVAFQLFTLRPLFVTTTSTENNAHFQKMYKTLDEVIPYLNNKNFTCSVIDEIYHLANVYFATHLPSSDFIEKTESPLREIFFSKAPDGAYAVRGTVTPNPGHIAKELCSRRQDSEQERLARYAALLQRMLDYEKPLTAAEVLMDPLFSKTSTTLLEKVS